MDEATLERVTAALEGLKGLAFAYLHGSHASGRARAESDVDVAFFVTREHAPRHDEIRDQVFHRLADILGSHRLDLVSIGAAGDVLRYEVVSRGRLLVCADRDGWAEFYVRALGRYFDSAHHRRILGEAIRRRIKEGEGPWSTQRSPRAA